MQAPGRTRVYLTVDVECAEERVRGGKPQPPLGYDLRVWGRLHDQRAELGLPVIVEELGRAGLRGTFFVETLGASYFGEEELRQVCRYLLAAGQDVQLHLHPVQRRVDWHRRGEARPSDEMADYPRRTQAAFLLDGIATLVRCGVPPALAFRAGNFGADRETWRAMADTGLVVSSNFNLCYRGTLCRIEWPRLENALFDTGVGVWELPVSCFQQGNGYRHLQISAVSFPEMRRYLLDAREAGVSEVTIVTHPFEFFVLDDAGAGRGRPNPFNVERLRRLCGFLRDHRDAFEVETVGALARRIVAGAAPRRPVPAPVPRGSAALRYARMVEQAYKRLSVRAAMPL